MSDELLHVFERHTLLEKIGDGAHAKGVRGEPRGQPGVFQAALDHSAEVMGPQDIFGQSLFAAHQRSK